MCTTLAEGNLKLQEVEKEIHARASSPRNYTDAGRNSELTTTHIRGGLWILRLNKEFLPMQVVGFLLKTDTS